MVEETRQAPASWSFDARAFGRDVRERREALGLSTRELARAARVSQPYVIALEGSRSSRDVYGPCPTVDVVARLATALAVEPTVLLASALRRSGPHVLVVVEDDGEQLFEVLRSQVGDVDTWVSAGHRHTAEWPHVALHDGHAESYDRGSVGAALRTGLSMLTPEIGGRRVGLVFSESPAILRKATGTVLALEHDWCDLVANRLRSTGAELAWNLCVYELDVLGQLDDPCAVGDELIATHDMVWCTRGRTVTRGRRAAAGLQIHLREARRPARSQARPTRTTKPDERKHPR